MSSVVKINQNSSTFLEFYKLYYDTESGKTNLPSSATVTITVYEADGTTEVTGMTFPHALTYNATKANGTFYGTLDPALNTTLHNRYIIQLDISGSGIPTTRYRFNARAVVPDNNPACFSC
jgi:hypothetical protein